MWRIRTIRVAIPAAAVAAAVLAALSVAPGQQKNQPAKSIRVKPSHVPEVRAMLSGLRVDEPRTHKNMVVFPIRWAGKHAPGEWETLDQAAEAKHLVISEKDRAAVSQILIENTGDKAVFLMSGEIIKGGKQTRVVSKDTVIEARQKVTLPVLCVERGRWRGGGKFSNSRNMAPASVRDTINRGGGQGRVWDSVRRTSKSAGEKSQTESLDEVLDSDKVRKAQEQVHKDVGKFSPDDTIGIAVADARTGMVVGLELFGRRDLFDALQAKLIEGYATDLVIAADKRRTDKPKKVAKKQVEAFIRRALDGASKYEDTPGSGRGIDLVSGRLRGKGVALGKHAIHLSIQDVRPEVTPARPIVRPRSNRRPGPAG